MKIKNQITMQRLVGKIDNDFNISESDWIPRVAAWTIDALSQLDVLPMVKKKRRLEVNERIAQYPCEINGKYIRVFDKNNIEIPALEYIEEKGCRRDPRRESSGDDENIAITNVSNTTRFNNPQVARIIKPNTKRNFVLNCNQIDLNFDTDYIFVETYEVATYYDEYYDCECPYIYDNGILLEALSWYVLFKYLSRGSKHPVYSLTAPNDVLNPFRQWNNLKYKASTAVKIQISKDFNGWNNFLYNSTFLPRK